MTLNKIKTDNMNSPLDVEMASTIWNVLKFITLTFYYNRIQKIIIAVIQRMYPKVN